MQLEAFLTVGWPDDADSRFAASVLHREADMGVEHRAIPEIKPAVSEPVDQVEPEIVSSDQGSDKALSKDDRYRNAILEALRATTPGTPVSGLERLFRRRSGAFRPLRRLVGELASAEAPENWTGQTLSCRIDAFAYAFLKSAKNFDFVLPRPAAPGDDFAAIHAQWSKTISDLEAFEREGRAMPRDSVSPARYLALREIVSRPSARDELRALVVLLTSGPSTMEEISEDLGLNYTLGQRTLAAYESPAAAVVERRSGSIFAIGKVALPLVVFCLREKMGLNLLPTISEE